jgi:RNA polymerase-binding protein
MSERALRGTRLGATSYESDSGIDLAPRQEIEYICANGHQFSMPFSMEAEVPAIWECRVCGAQALRRDGAAPEEKAGKPVRTHWDMLLERRSLTELEEVLAERLGVLRRGGIPFAAMAATPAPAPTAKAAEAGDGRPALAAAGRATVKKAASSASKGVKAAPATKTTPKPARKAPAKSPAAKSAVAER